MPNSRSYEKPPSGELRKKLTPIQFKVSQEGATEPPFRNEYFDHHERGIYVDVATGEPLFSSQDKFESGTGWPSFWKPLPNAVSTTSDRSLMMERTEVHCARCAGHLGHVFDDGPPPTGLRYCMNGVALAFVPGSA